MLSLGLDLSERPARAVVIDEAGEVVARGSGADAADALSAATHTPSPDVAGVALFNEAEAPPVAGVKVVTRCTPGAAAIAAESWIGAARGARHAVCLYIGDEVFAGLLLDGKPWSGAHGRAGAAAWLALNPVERQDYRKLGSLAAEVSAKGIARRLSWRVQAGDRSRVAGRVHRGAHGKFDTCCCRDRPFNTGRQIDRPWLAFKRRHARAKLSQFSTGMNVAFAGDKHQTGFAIV